MAEINSSLKIEMDAAKHNWLDVLNTPGNRRRALVSAGLGLFTQWSGNTLISYYLGDLLEMIGYTNSLVKQKVNGVYRGDCPADLPALTIFKLPQPVGT